MKMHLLRPPAPNTSTPLALTANRPNSRSSPSNSGSSFNNGARTGDNRRRRVQCQICSRSGHEAIDCWQRNNQQDYPSRRPRDTSRAGPRQANLTQHSSSHIAADPAWYLDSGATDHIQPDFQNLNITEEYKGPDKLQVGDGPHNPPRGR